MNLYAYDIVNRPLNKNETWINTKRQVLYSREIKYEPYNILLRRYDPKTNSFTYYIGMVKEKPTDYAVTRTVIDDYGRIKIHIDSIFKELAKDTIPNNQKIKLVLVEESDEGEIYLIENI